MRAFVLRSCLPRLAPHAATAAGCQRRALAATAPLAQGKRPSLPFGSQDVDATRLTHPYWDMPAGAAAEHHVGPYDGVFGDEFSHDSLEFLDGDKELLTKEFL
jgi:hypothetical protein